jgi:hypothetical protein
MKHKIAVIASCAALGAGTGAMIAPGAAATPASTSAGAGTGADVTTSGHSPGQPINTRRCRKLIRKINRADRRGKDRRVRRLSRKYNRTCRR